MTDALRFYGDIPDPECGGANVIVGDFFRGIEPPRNGEIYFQAIGPDFTGFRFSNLYVPAFSLLPDGVSDTVIEHALTKKPKMIFNASRTLEEVGKCDTKYGCSPIFYLHRCGLLTNAMIAGGVYLDRDDADLMTQENASLILTPTLDAGIGNGIPPLRMYLDRGLRIFLGTAGSRFNTRKSIRYEADVLRLLVNGAMCGEVIGEMEVERILKQS